MISEIIRLEHHYKSVDHVSANDIVHGNPAEKSVESIETGSD